MFLHDKVLYIHDAKSTPKKSKCLLNKWGKSDKKSDSHVKRIGDRVRKAAKKIQSKWSEKSVFGKRKNKAILKRYYGFCLHSFFALSPNSSALDFFSVVDSLSAYIVLPSFDAFSQKEEAKKKPTLMFVNVIFFTIISLGSFVDKMTH